MSQERLSEKELATFLEEYAPRQGGYPLLDAEGYAFVQRIVAELRQRRAEEDWRDTPKPPGSDDSKE